MNDNVVRSAIFDEGANLYEAVRSFEDNVRVETVPLATLFPNLSPQFIKCEVEGKK